MLFGVYAGIIFRHHISAQPHGASVSCHCIKRFVFFGEAKPQILLSKSFLLCVKYFGFFVDWKVKFMKSISLHSGVTTLHSGVTRPLTLE